MISLTYWKGLVSRVKLSVVVPQAIGISLRNNDWEVKNYETQARGCWTIQTVQKKLVKQCFLVSIIPKIFEKKRKEYPTLKSTNISIKQIPRYKERESLVMHIEQVSKNFREHGRLDGGMPINQYCRHGKQLGLTL